jgi:hypothetical protein
VRPEEQVVRRSGSFPPDRSASGWWCFREASCTQRAERRAGLCGPGLQLSRPGSVVACVRKVARLISEHGRLRIVSIDFRLAGGPESDHERPCYYYVSVFRKLLRQKSEARALLLARAGRMPCLHRTQSFRVPVRRTAAGLAGLRRTAWWRLVAWECSPEAAHLGLPLPRQGKFTTVVKTASAFNSGVSHGLSSIPNSLSCSTLRLPFGTSLLILRNLAPQCLSMRNSGSRLRITGSAVTGCPRLAGWLPRGLPT